jgi:palmitoyltransferase ZDHHC9/14/18
MPFLKKHGRHHPCCGGACLVARTGCSLNMLPVSFLLIVGPSALWLLRVAPALGYSAAVSAVGIALLALSLLNLFACYLTEPGLLRVVDAAGASPDERPRKLVVAGVGPPRELVDFRAKFCRETGNVVEVFDHFCPWTGNAVGRRNYRYYFCFLVFTTALALVVGITSATSATSASSATSAKNGVALGSNVYVLWLLVLFTVIILLLVGGLLSYHIPLVSSNRTTNETIKEVYKTKANPYDRGCCRNWATFLATVVQRPRPSYFEAGSGGGAGDGEEDTAGLLYAGP